MPGGMGSGFEMRTVENVTLAARLGDELGADWVKVPYVPGFQQVTARCFKPVVILGGSKRDTVAEVLTMAAVWLIYFRLLGRLAWYCAACTARVAAEIELDEDEERSEAGQGRAGEGEGG